MSSPPRVVGLVGGMGSGKTHVAAAFARRGAVVVSADAAGHEALRQPEVRDRVVRRWGTELLDESGEIVRPRLAAIVFADPAQRRELEAMVFPWIEQRMRGQIADARAAGHPLVILDAALLFEAGWHVMCDEVVFVRAPRAVRLERLLQQRGWTLEVVEAREQAQWSLTEKARRAHHAIDNSGSEESLERQVEDLLGQWGLTGECPSGLPS